jgi:response regulator RpfG family c-di-GMP phosphodiesterase
MLENVLVEFVNSIDEEAILVIDANNTILFFNQGAEKLFKKNTANMLGTKLDDLISLNFNGSMTVKSPGQNGSPCKEYHENESFFLSIEREDGSIIPVSGTLRKVISEGCDYFTVALSKINPCRSSHDLMNPQCKWVNTVHRIESEVTHGDDINELLEVVVEEAINQLNVDAVTILKFDPKRKELVYSLGKGFFTNALKHTRLKVGEGNAGKAAQEKGIIYLRNFTVNIGELMKSPEFLAEGFASYHAIPMYVEERLLGVIELFRRSDFDPDQEWYDYLQNLADQTAIALENFEVIIELKQSQQDILHAYDETLEGWVHGLDIRVHESNGHTRRVTEQSLSLATVVGLPEDQLQNIRRGSLLHDIGNAGVPDRVLLKPDVLTEEERNLVRQHPNIAREMLYPISYLRPALDIPYCHHEWWDGSGYPRGIRGDAIPMAARIFTIVDVWDSLLSNRPYRPAWSRGQVIKYMHAMTGIQFDPGLMDIFWKMVQD